MATSHVNGMDLYYEVHGDGPPLALVAGLASDSQSWLPVIPSLADRFTVIVYDQRGVGRTRPADAEITIPLFAADCAASIESLGYAKVCLVGHSMGGFIAQACAALRPDLVDRLVLVGTALDDSRRNDTLLCDMADLLEGGARSDLWFRNLFAWIFTRRFFEDDAAVAEAVRYALEYPYPQSPGQFRRQVEAVVQFEGVDPSRITAKTLVLTGAEDLLFPSDEGRALAARLPNAEFAVIPSAAHSVHTEAPETFVDSISRFLGRDL